MYSAEGEAAAREVLDLAALSADCLVLSGAILAAPGNLEGVVGAGRGDSAPVASIPPCVSSSDTGDTASFLDEAPAAVVSGAPAEVESADPDGGGTPGSVEFPSLESVESDGAGFVEVVFEFTAALRFVFALLAFSAASNPAWRIATAKDASAPPVGDFEVDSVDVGCLDVASLASFVESTTLDGVAEAEAAEDWVVASLDGVLVVDAVGVEAAAGRGAVEANCSWISPYSFHSSTSSRSYRSTSDNFSRLVLRGNPYTHDHAHSHQTRKLPFPRSPTPQHPSFFVRRDI